MRFLLIFLFLTTFVCKAFSQNQNESDLIEIEAGVWIYKPIAKEAYNSIVIVDSASIILFDTQLNDDENKNIINLLRIKFPEKSLQFIFTTSPDLGRFIGVKYFKSVWPKAQFVMPKYGSEWMFGIATSQWNQYQSNNNNVLKLSDLILPDLIITSDTIFKIAPTFFNIYLTEKSSNYSCLNMQITESGTGFGFAHYSNKIRINESIGNSLLINSRVLERLTKNHLTRFIGNDNAQIYTTYEIERRLKLLKRLVNSTNTKLDRGLTLEEMYKTVRHNFRDLSIENYDESLEKIYNELKDERKPKPVEDSKKRNRLRKSLDKSDSQRSEEPEQ